jgi:hypothetical protein
MFEKDIIKLNLKPGDPVRIWVYFREDPYEGVYVDRTGLLFTWKNNHATQAKSISELVKIEKIENP